MTFNDHHLLGGRAKRALIIAHMGNCKDEWWPKNGGIKRTIVDIQWAYHRGTKDQKEPDFQHQTWLLNSASRGLFWGYPQKKQDNGDACDLTIKHTDLSNEWWIWIDLNSGYKLQSQGSNQQKNRHIDDMLNVGMDQGSNPWYPFKAPCRLAICFLDPTLMISYALYIPKQTSTRNPSNNWIGKSVDLWYSC